MSYILSKIRKHKLIVLFIVVGTVLRSTFALGMAGYSKYVFDGIGQKSIAVGSTLAIGLLVTAWGAVGLLIKGIAIDSLVSRVSYEMRSDYVGAVIGCPVPKLKELGEGRVLTNYSQDIGAVAGLVRSGLDLVTIPFEMVIALCYLYFQNWKMAAVITVIFPVIMVSGQMIGKQIQKISSAYLIHDDKAMKLVTRIMKGIEVIKVHDYQKDITAEFDSLIRKQLGLDLSRAKYNGAFTGITDFFMGLPFIIVYVTTVLFAVGSNITAGTLTLFLQLLNKITVPFVTYSRVVMQFKQAKVSMDRLAEVISGETETHSPVRGFGRVAFEDVFFGYPGGELLLKNCSMSLEKGKYYGVIGGNGSGKSTICRLIMQLYQPVSGVIVYENDLQGCNKIVYIEDKPVVLYDDIIRNIVGSCKQEKDRLDRILEETELKTSASDNIEGKTADELSAGLLQRMVIARALYQIDNNDMLIIDEGFSALDIDMRPKMYRLVKKYQQKYHLTVLDITHNFDEREEFDEVILVEDGRISLKQGWFR